MRERWGALSVRDHVSDAPLVTEVLLYDRLIVPIPPPGDKTAEKYWTKQRWEPDVLNECLDILKVKTEKQDGLALTVPWDESKRKRFKSRMSMAAALATQQRNPEQTYCMDPFEMTRELLKDEFRPALPPGISKAWTAANYPSAQRFRRDNSDKAAKRRTQLALSLSYHLLTPTRSDPKHKVLKRAVDLATTDDYRRKRTRFHEWQEEIIEENISNEKAIQELDHLLKAYNEATRKAFRNVVARYAFTVIPIGLGMGGAAIAKSEPGLFIAGASGLVQLTRFWKFDRKPVIANGDLDAAAMVHDARNVWSLTVGQRILGGLRRRPRPD
jgi:hypothetical protein